MIALVDGTGTKVVEYTYDAWGKPTGKTGTMASTLGTVQPFRYRGYVYDEETGLYYLRSRYYRPEWCRFVSADFLLFVKKSGDKNCFSYCESNPVTRLDGDGYAWWHWLIGATIVIACAAAVVITAGGVVAGMAAVASVANGAVAGTVSTTVAASALIGSSLTLGTAAIEASIESESADDFAEKGNWGTVISTVGACALGVGIGFYKGKKYNSNHFFGTTSPKKLKEIPRNAYYTQWNSEGDGVKALVRFDAGGHQLWRIDYLGQSHNGIETPHLHIYTGYYYNRKGTNNVFPSKGVDWSGIIK